MTASAKNFQHQSGLPKRQLPREIWLAFGFGFPALMLLLLVQSSLRSSFAVTTTLQITAFLLASWLLGLLYTQKKNRVEFTVSFVPLAPHYVQLIVQLCIYAYWGWYWRPVYDHIGLIVAQLALAYSLDMLLSLTRRRRWVFGFGPFPIILSTNLFLLFKPEWFYLQFAMVAVGILGKEFIRWERDGKNTHIFNPSALSLFVFSVALIVTDTTSWSFAQEIATTLNRAPHIYLQIFLLGLVVQYLFSVTLVTLMSALALIGLNLAYTQTTGTYFFVDSNIPIAVFLGLHLLITDPATSPRTAQGKAIFGVLYGSGVFLMYGFLGWLGVPTFYDKLLCVPVLNLMVPLIDAMARKLPPIALGERKIYSDISAKANRIHMLIWIIVFSIMLGTSFVGPGHPGNDLGFWENACDSDRRNGCQTLFEMNRTACRDGNATACIRAGGLVRKIPVLEDQLELGKLLSRGCDLGRPEACDEFRDYIRMGGQANLDDACAENDYASCFISGLVSMFAVGTPVDVQSAITRWSRACEGGWARACGFLGETYLLGKNVNANPELAADYLKRACSLEYQSACVTLALMHQRGHGVPQDEVRGRELLQTACESGWQQACDRIR